MRQKSLFRLIVQPLVLATGLAIAVKVSLFQIYTIPSSSMEPTLRPGDQILVTPYRFPFPASDPKAGDVVVFRSPVNARETIVKRVVGVPGDLIQARNGRMLIGGRSVPEAYLLEPAATGEVASLIIPAAGYFVMGDNRRNSIDSRTWGAVPRELVVGRARLVLWSAWRRSPAAEAHASTPSGTVASWPAARRMLLIIR